jgi:hypothetical protein
LCFSNQAYSIAIYILKSQAIKVKVLQYYAGSFGLAGALQFGICFVSWHKSSLIRLNLCLRIAAKSLSPIHEKSTRFEQLLKARWV